MTKSIKSPAEFMRTYKIDSTGTYGERAAEFLNAAADELPYRFFDKVGLAKITFGLSRTPSIDSNYVRDRLSSALGSADRILIKKYGRTIYIDKVEGVRATVDDTDIVRTKHRRKRRKVKAAVISLQQTDGMIDSSRVSADVRNELLKSRKSLKELVGALDVLPQLMPAKGKADG